MKNSVIKITNEFQFQNLAKDTEWHDYFEPHKLHVIQSNSGKFIMLEQFGLIENCRGEEVNPHQLSKLEPWLNEHSVFLKIKKATPSLRSIRDNTSRSVTQLLKQNTNCSQFDYGRN